MQSAVFVKYGYVALKWNLYGQVQKKNNITHSTWFKNRLMLMLPGSVNYTAAYSALTDVSLYCEN